MAVLPMKRIFFIGMKNEEENVLSELQSLGVVEISDEAPMENFNKNEENEILHDLNADKQTLNEAIEILSTYSLEKHSLLSSLEGKKNIDADEFADIGNNIPSALQLAEKTIALNKELLQMRADILRPAAEIRNLSLWENLDISINERGSKHTRVFIGTLSQSYTGEKLTEILCAKMPKTDFVAEVIYADTIQSAVFVLCHKSDEELIEASLRSLGFAYPQNDFTCSPQEQIAALNLKIDEIQANIKASETNLTDMSAGLSELECAYDYLAVSAEREEAKKKLLQSKTTFALSGYVLEQNAKKTVRKLENKYNVYCEILDAEDENAPVAIVNNAFAAPCESVLESYSYPAKGEIDPTGIMSIFYYVLFGIMLGDAAYGLIMALCSFIALKKFPQMGEGLKKTLKLFFYCGLSTLFWGAIFGSWFGDCVGVIAKTFFNSDFTINAIWFEPVNDPMKMLVFSLALGLVHLSTGLVLNGVQALKRHSISDFIFDTVFWFGLVYSLVIMLLPTALFTSLAGMNVSIPKVVVSIAQITAVVCAIGIILTSGRESKNWFKRILKGLYGLYNISGWLSDILSYSRLLALGLASGVIATVINQMGSMGGDGVFGTILFAVVFLVGHIFNMAINLLGAYVHTNRLQFVEFFGKFYSGGGQKFVPFAKKTKYYNIQETIQK